MSRNSIFYKKYISTHYQDIIGDINDSYHKRLFVWKSLLEHYLPKEKNVKILEVGSGMGLNLFSLKEMGYKNVLGIDYSKDCVKFCKRLGLSSLLVRNDKKYYKNNPKKFDIIILYDVLEHYFPSDAYKLLINIKQSLKNDGKLIISVPNADYPLNLGLLYKDITHKFIYNPVSLVQLLCNCGFYHNVTFQMNSFTTYDDRPLFYFLKRYIITIVSHLGELFWKVIGLTQGVFIKDCRPTLMCVAKF